MSEPYPPRDDGTQPEHRWSGDRPYGQSEPTVQFPPQTPSQPAPYDPYHPPPPPPSQQTPGPGYAAPNYPTPSYPPTAQFPPVAYPPGYGPPDYGQPGYGQPGYGQPIPPYNDSMNGFAIASFVLSFCGSVPLSLIFGLVALRQIRRKGGRGRGFAVAGLAITGAWMLLCAAGGVYAIVTDPDRNASGQITSGGRVAVTDLKVGDCVNDIEENKRVLTLPAVPCAEPHDAEVFAVFDLSGSTFPGESEVVSQVESSCVDRLEEYAPAAVNDPSIDLYYFAPDETSWRRGDREVVCVALDPNKQRTGSLRA
jgi:hypothetical protein